MLADLVGPQMISIIVTRVVETLSQEDGDDKIDDRVE